ncbi:hypothetical protein [Mastigocladopsis repens]|uniref:hypothetical protein n=1 Tax=Mastigocladopsis repens TaxID=221287 RepID=UPI0012E9F3ED|nr:hypothetical protein [Mastigocladopsis repens]
MTGFSFKPPKWSYTGIYPNLGKISMACEGANKATINLFKNGSIYKRIVVDSPPVTLECLKSQKECQAVIVAVEVLFSSGRTQVYSDRLWSPISDLIIENNSVIRIKNRGYPSIEGCREEAHRIFYFVSDGTIKAAKIISITDASGNSFADSQSEGIRIRNKENTIVFEEMNIPCEGHQISCDDECPPGHIRCETSAYPGYCCIPCNEIKSEIAAMRSIIRRLNG